MYNDHRGFNCSSQYIVGLLDGWRGNADSMLFLKVACMIHSSKNPQGPLLGFLTPSGEVMQSNYQSIDRINKTLRLAPVNHMEQFKHFSPLNHHLYTGQMSL